MLTHTSARNRERGFTLIELLTVAIVVGVLAAVSTPIFLRHRDKATVESVRKDAEQAGLALTAQVTGSGTLPATLNPDTPNVWGYKASSPNNRLVEYAVAEDRFRICILNAVANPDAWAVYTSATEKVTSGTGTEPTGACDGNPSAPALAAEPTRGPSTPIPTPTPTAIPTVDVPVPVPTGVSATTVMGESRATVTWGAVSGATGYRIYVDGSTTPAWSGTAASANVPSLSNGSHTFRVSAMRDTRESDLSTSASATVDSNDNIAEAHTATGTISVASNWVSANHSNATATVQSGETTPTARSLWWRFRPTTIGTYDFTTIPASDGSAAPASPVVTVFKVPSGSTAVPSPNPTVLTRGFYNPDGSQTASGEAPLVTVQSGYDYLVRVSTPTTTDTGTFRVRVTRGPGADMLASPTMISQPGVGFSNSTANTSINAGAEAGETGANRSSVWYGMQKVRNTDIKFEVTGNGFTPVITVYASSATSPGSLGAPIKSLTGTTLTLTDAEVPYGTHLRIRVSASSGTPSAFTLNVSSISAVAPLPSCFVVNWDGAATIYWNKPDSRVNGYDIAIDSPYGREWYYVDGNTTSYIRGNLQYEETATVTARTPDGNIPQCGGPVGAGW